MAPGKKAPQSFQLTPLPSWYHTLVEACCKMHYCKMEVKRQPDPRRCPSCRQLDSMTKNCELILTCTKCGWVQPAAVDGWRPVITGKHYRACVDQLNELINDFHSQAEKGFPGNTDHQIEFKAGAADAVLKRAQKIRNQKRSTERTSASAEQRIVDEMYRLARNIFTATEKLEFGITRSLLHEMKSLLKQGRKLPDADPDPGEYDNYPPEHCSDYLNSKIADKALKRIIAVSSRYKCSCIPRDCSCSPAEESGSDTKGSCHFCEEEFPRFSTIYWLKLEENDGLSICNTCKNALLDKLYPQRSLADDIDNLVTDACDEVCYFQFSTALSYVERALDRVEEF